MSAPQSKKPSFLHWVTALPSHLICVDTDHFSSHHAQDTHKSQLELCGLKKSHLPGGEGVMNQSCWYLVGLRQRGVLALSGPVSPGYGALLIQSGWVFYLVIVGKPSQALLDMCYIIFWVTKSILLTIQINDHSELLLCSDPWDLFSISWQATLKMCLHDSCQTTSVGLKTITTGSVNLFIMLPFLASKHIFYSFWSSKMASF